MRKVDCCQILLEAVAVLVPGIRIEALESFQPIEDWQNEGP